MYGAISGQPERQQARILPVGENCGRPFSASCEERRKARRMRRRAPSSLVFFLYSALSPSSILRLRQCVLPKPPSPGFPTTCRTPARDAWGRRLKRRREKKESGKERGERSFASSKVGPRSAVRRTPTELCVAGSKPCAVKYRRCFRVRGCR